MLKISAYVIDSKLLFREGLRSVLEQFHYEVVGEADSVDALLRGETAAKDAELVIFDLPTTVKDINGFVTGLRSCFVAAKLIVLTGTGEPERVEKAVAAGIDGYLLKDISPDDLFDSLAQVLSGHVVQPARCEEAADAGEQVPDCVVCYEELDAESRCELDRSDPTKDKRDVALGLCRELGHFDAVRTCRRHRWYDLLAAIQENRTDALALPSYA